VHQEATRHLHRTLELIRRRGPRVGVVLNPASPLESLSEVLDIVDFVLIMSVDPGFGGQKFIPSSVRKIERLAALKVQHNPALRIEVDGGITQDTVGKVVRAGADVLVAGNAIFGAGDPKVNTQTLLKTALEATLLKV
jgi:ribulose-phosphate 3-epimerase